MSKIITEDISALDANIYHFLNSDSGQGAINGGVNNGKQKKNRLHCRLRE
jgi:hypothetical protein